MAQNATGKRARLSVSPAKPCVVATNRSNALPCQPLHVPAALPPSHKPMTSKIKAAMVEHLRLHRPRSASPASHFQPAPSRSYKPACNAADLHCQAQGSTPRQLPGPAVPTALELSDSISTCDTLHPEPSAQSPTLLHCQQAEDNCTSDVLTQPAGAERIGIKQCTVSDHDAQHNHRGPDLTSDAGEGADSRADRQPLLNNTGLVHMRFPRMDQDGPRSFSPVAEVNTASGLAADVIPCHSMQASVMMMSTMTSPFPEHLMHGQAQWEEAGSPGNEGIPAFEPRSRSSGGSSLDSAGKTQRGPGDSWQGHSDDGMLTPKENYQARRDALCHNTV